MIRAIRRTILPLLLTTVALSANAQFERLHVGSISVGAFGEFNTPLTTNASSTTFHTGVLTENASGQQQFTTDSVGMLTSIQIHPVAWAGVELNYGLTHYSERYTLNYSSTTSPQTVNVPVFNHEATAAYVIHPRHIPLQPFVTIGGGAVDFLPPYSSNQWRGTGLVETGIDIPGGGKHLAFRIEGRALVYRAPNFNNPVLSTRSWRVTEQPSVSVVYRF